MNRIEWFLVKNGEGAGGEGADKEGTEKARGMSDGDGVDGRPVEISVFFGLMDDGEDGLEMGASGDFGDDSTIGLKEVDLGNDDITFDLVSVDDNGRSGFVARSFDTKDIHRGNYNMKGWK